MDLKELKKITAYARKAGIKSLKFADVSIEFNEATTPQRAKRLIVVEEDTVKKPTDPTLEQINDYIYGQTDEAG